MAEVGAIDATSQSGSVAEFISSRQKLYSHVPRRYPFFFDRTKELEGIRLGSINKFDMTESLGQRILSYQPGQLSFDMSRALGSDRSMFEQALKPIQDKVLFRDGLAITRDLLDSNKGNFQLSSEQIAAASRIVSALYMKIYADQRSLRVCTGIPYFRYSEIMDGFPSYDYPILKNLIIHLAGKNAFSSFAFDDICGTYFEQEHQRFGYHCEAFLESALSAIRNQINAPDSLQTLRTLLMQFLQRELDGHTLFRFKSLTEFYQLASGKLFERGRQISASNKLFSEKWSEYMPKENVGLILFTTATDTEATALVASLQESGFKRLGTRRAGEGFVEEYSRGHGDLVAHLRTSAGSIGVNSAGGTLPPSLASLTPKYVISAGICFGLKSLKHGHGKQELGDVVVSGHVQDYETKRIGERVVARGERLPAGVGLLAASRIARDQTSRDGWSFHEGLILSGQKLADDKEFTTGLISDFPDAVAGEMEGNAVASSATYAKVEWIVIKGICDWGIEKEDGWQDLAAKRASRLAVDTAVTILSSS
jgi:nucleoside phosphorylase